MEKSINHKTYKWEEYYISIGQKRVLINKESMDSPKSCWLHREVILEFTKQKRNKNKIYSVMVTLLHITKRDHGVICHFEILKQKNKTQYQQGKSQNWSFRAGAISKSGLTQRTFTKKTELQQ